MAYYLTPPRGQPPSIAPSLDKKARGVGTDGVEPSASTIQTVVSPVSESVPVSDKKGQANGSAYPYPTVAEPGNPTVIPRKILEQFHFAFLIRHPKHSIPSYTRCTTKPLSDVTGWNYFLPEEAGYDELRRVFDWFKDEGVTGPEIADRHANGVTNGTNGTSKRNNEICVIDADDLLDNPEGIMRKFCASVGIKFEPSMLQWDTPEDHEFARNKFEKWRGWHDDAINSTGLVARTHVRLSVLMQTRAIQ